MRHTLRYLIPQIRETGVCIINTKETMYIYTHIYYIAVPIPVHMHHQTVRITLSGNCRNVVLKRQIRFGYFCLLSFQFSYFCWLRLFILFKIYNSVRFCFNYYHYKSNTLIYFNRMFLFCTVYHKLKQQYSDNCSS